MPTNKNDFWLDDDDDDDDDIVVEKTPAPPSAIAVDPVPAKKASLLDEEDIVHVVPPKSGEVLQIDRATGTGPSASKLRLVGLTSTAPNPEASSTAARRERLEELRSVRRRDVIALHGIRPSLQTRAHPESIVCELNHVRSRHTDLAIELPPVIVRRRDAAFRNYLKEQLENIRGQAEQVVRRDLQARDNKVLERRAHAQIARELEERGDENEEEPSDQDVKNLVAAMKQAERARVREELAVEEQQRLSALSQQPRPPVDPANISKERVQERLDSRYDAIVEERVNKLLGAVLDDFKVALDAQQYDGLPFVREEIREYFEKVLDRRYKRASTEDSLPFDNDDDEMEFYELIVKTYTLSPMAEEWLDAWTQRQERGGGDRAAIDEVRRAIVGLVTGVRVTTNNSKSLPYVLLNDRRVIDLDVLANEFNQAVHALTNRGNNGQRALLRLEASLAGTRVRGAHFAGLETAQAATAVFRAVNELNGFEATLERSIAKLSSELETIAAYIEVPLIIERLVRDTHHGPVAFEVRVEASSPDHDLLAQRSEFAFAWHHVGADGTDRVVRTAPRARRDRLEVAVSQAAGGRYYVVATGTDQTVLTSARATLRIMARCSRDGVVYELSPSSSPYFGECRWRTRPVSTKRKRNSPFDELDDASLLRLTVLGREGVRKELFTLDAMVRSLKSRDVNVTFDQSTSILSLVTELRTGSLRDATTERERRFIDVLYERLTAFALVRLRTDAETALAGISRFNEAAILQCGGVWRSEGVRSGSEIIERQTILVDTASEREFWQTAELARERQRTAAVLRCEAQRLPVEAPFMASRRSAAAEPLCQEADWRGFHSHTNDQPEPYTVNFSDDDTGPVIVRRGSARLSSGYDFDGLHELITNEIAEYTVIVPNQLGWRGARQLSRKRAQHLVYAYNVLAINAPNRDATDSLVRAEEIMHRFSKISYEFSSKSSSGPIVIPPGFRP